MCQPDCVEAEGLGYIQITDPEDPNGAYKVAKLDGNKRYNVKGKNNNAGKAITKVWCQDVTPTDPDAPLEVSVGNPRDGGMKFDFTDHEVLSKYGVRHFKVRCEFNNDPKDTDNDPQEFAAVPNQLSVTFAGTTQNTCGGPGSCTKANTLSPFTLTWGLGPNDPLIPWKWGYEIPEPNTNYICNSRCIVAVLTTADVVGAIQISVKPSFDAQTAIARFQKANWDFTFPGGSITLGRISPAIGTSNACNWPESITVAPLPA